MTGTAAAAPARAGARAVWLSLVLVLGAIEALLILADARWLGSPLWRLLAWQNGGFWAGLWRGWTPNFAAQPVTMCVTYAFLHVGWQHLVGNLMVLAWLGWRLERVMTALQFAALYAVSALGGAAAFGLLSASPRPMVGASGAIMGLLAAWIAADARAMARRGKPRRRIWHMAGLRAAAITAANAVAALDMFGGLAWEAHLGGFLAAALALWALPALRPGDNAA